MAPGLILASRVGDGSKARRYAARSQQEFGRNVTVLTSAEREKHVLTSGYKHAVKIPDSPHIQPLNYCLGLAREILQLGGSVYQESRVTAMSDHQGGKRLQPGTVSARQVLVTTHGYTRGLLPAPDRTYVPIAPVILRVGIVSALLTQLLSRSSSRSD